jgi:uncharacterized membrane protein
MRFILVLLALAGAIVSGLALHVHYSNDMQPCDLNAHWDCGIVNHSRYAEFHHIPVASIGIVGYLVLAAFVLLRRRLLTVLAALLGLAYALYLTNIEAHKLEVWCLYCVASQGIIALIALLSLAWLFMGRREAAS